MKHATLIKLARRFKTTGYDVQVPDFASGHQQSNLSNSDVVPLAIGYCPLLNGFNQTPDMRHDIHNLGTSTIVQRAPDFLAHAVCIHIHPNTRIPHTEAMHEVPPSGDHGDGPEGEASSVSPAS